MKLFKERLLQLVSTVLAFVIILAIPFGLLKLLELIHPAIPAVLILIILVVGVTVGIIQFVNWLFIEPFRKRAAE